MNRLYTNELQIASLLDGAAFFPTHGKAPLPGWRWTERYSRHTADVAAWRAAGHNIALNAGASGVIVADIDAKGNRDEAWAAWRDVCAAWGLAEPVAPAWQTPSGGWHVVFRVPEGVDATTLKQPDALKGRINIRAGNGFVVCPPSDGYLMLPGAVAHEAPPALIEHCTRTARATEGSSLISSDYDLDDVRALFQRLADAGEFVEYESWLRSGMVAKLFGDAGLELWRITHDATVTPDVEAAKWKSFDEQPGANAVRLESLLKRAHELGWQGSIRRTSEAMFADLASIASPPIAPEQPRPLLSDRIFSAATLAGKTPPAREWLVHEWIPNGQVTLIYGDGGVGKSLLALHLAACAAASAPWFFRQVRSGPVLFITAEDSKDELHRRLADVSRENGIPIENMEALHLASFADADAIMAALHGDGSLAETALYAELCTLCASVTPVAVFLDTLADVFAGNENVRVQARQFVAMLRKIAIGQNCALIVLAHPSLAGMNDGTGRSGNTGWNNSVRSRMYFTRVEDDSGHVADEDLRVLKLMKSNYSKIGTEILMRYRGGAFVPEGQPGASGDPLQKQAKAERVFLELLEKNRGQNIRVGVNVNGGNYAPKIFRDDAARQGVSRVELKDAMRRLLDTGRIINVPHGPPSKPVNYLEAAS